MPLKSKKISLLRAMTLVALLAGISAAGVKNVAVVEMEIDAQSGAAAEITPAEVRLMTAGLRREAVKNLPKERYNIMTSETVYAQGGAVLEACVDENCVITLGSKIGADYIVRGIISKLRARFALSVEIYETENGNLVASSELVSSENVGELVEKAAGACAEMYKTFANATQSAAPQTTQPKQTVTYTVTAAANPNEGGYVARNPNQTNYAPGTVVSLTAIPSDGYRFIGWSGASTSAKPKLKIPIDRDLTLTANFQYVQQTNTSAGGRFRTHNPDSTKQTADSQHIGARPKRRALSMEESIRNSDSTKQTAEFQVIGTRPRKFSPAVDVEDFSIVRRLGTCASNVVPTGAFPTGLGSFILMKDYVGGGIQLGATVTFIALLANDAIDSDVGTAISVYAIVANTFNIVRSATYHKPKPKSSAAANNFKPYDGLKLAILPTESGDYKVLARYDYSF